MKHHPTTRWKMILALTSAICLMVFVLPLAGTAYPGSDIEIRRVVVIHLDSTRMNDLGCYGGLARTPNIDGVAARGLRYTNSITPIPQTSPSIASFMTGRLPDRHGVYGVVGKLKESFTTLPELLQAYGFKTGGFVSNPVVDRLHTDSGRTAGFDQGFSVFEGIRDVPRTPEGTDPNDVPRNLCKPLVEAALDFIDRNQNDPFFLWMLHQDPHAPYAPPAPYDTLYLDHPEVTSGSTTLNPAEIQPNAYVKGRLESHEYVARHLGEVTLTDYWVGVLLRRIDQLPGRTLLVITADHGESLGDAGYWFGHGFNIRHPCVNVPLIIACDGLVPFGTSDALVANIDLAPTILELLGISPTALGTNGFSLGPTFRHANPWSGRMIPIQAYNGIRWRGVRSARHCLQSEFDPSDGSHLRTMLYHVEADPLESIDVSATMPDVYREHLAVEHVWFSGDGHAPDHELLNHPEVIQRLQSLGYLR
jgi:arylsulfatase A-like enzyme